jgi:hypothetical protein
MDLPTLFFLYRGIGSHDSGCGIRFFVAAGGRLLFDGARGPVEDTFATSPEWVACSMSQTAGGSPGDWVSSSMRMATPSRKLYCQGCEPHQRTLPASNTTQRCDCVDGEGKD